MTTVNVGGENIRIFAAKDFIGQPFDLCELHGSVRFNVNNAATKALSPVRQGVAHVDIELVEKGVHGVSLYGVAPGAFRRSWEHCTGNGAGKKGEALQ